MNEDDSRRRRDLEVRANELGTSILGYTDLDAAAAVLSKLIEENNKDE